jgi:hypothetical protein
MFDLPFKVETLMRGFDPDWFVAGGWALDLFLKTETRPHDDIEIAVFRADQFALQKHFAGWRLQKAFGGELNFWEKGEFLESPIHEIHCFNELSKTSELEILLNERTGSNWVFRRNEKITKPLAETYGATDSGIKFLRPEIVLLYKSKNPRPKDEQDFRAAVKSLDGAAKSWLKNALSMCYERHDWIEKL